VTTADGTQLRGGYELARRLRRLASNAVGHRGRVTRARAEELRRADLIRPIVDASTVREASVTGQRYTRSESWAEQLFQL
jgi:hypothetical protein